MQHKSIKYSMTRLQRLLTHKEDGVRHPDDIFAIKEYIPELRGLPDVTVQNIYSNYSEDYFCAGWLIIQPEIMASFREWLLEEVVDG